MKKIAKSVLISIVAGASLCPTHGAHGQSAPSKPWVDLNEYLAAHRDEAQQPASADGSIPRAGSIGRWQMIATGNGSYAWKIDTQTGAAFLCEAKSRGCYRVTTVP
jgi:hypothetical protein